MKIIDIHTHVYPEKIAPAAIRTVREFYRLVKLAFRRESGL